MNPGGSVQPYRFLGICDPCPPIRWSRRRRGSDPVHAGSGHRCNRCRTVPAQARLAPLSLSSGDAAPPPCIYRRRHLPYRPTGTFLVQGIALRIGTIGMRRIGPWYGRRVEEVASRHA